MRRRRIAANDESGRERPDLPVDEGAASSGVDGPEWVGGVEAELDAVYALLASDRDRERKALEWAEALIGDGDPLGP